MDILFLGGTGNLSADCAALLQSRGHRVTLLTRGKRPVSSEFESLSADYHDPDSVRNVLGPRQFDTVVNFIGYEVADVRRDLEIFSGRVGQYLFISTTVVYAKPPARLPITEEAPTGNEFSAYGRHKQACEERLLEACRDARFPVTIVRPSHTYSRAWIPNPVTSVGYTLAARLEQGRPVFVHDNGEGLWTLTSTTDFAVGLAGLLGRESCIGEVYQITSDFVYTWNEIMAEICRALGVSRPDIVHIPTDFISDVAPIMHDKLKGDKAHDAVFDCGKVKAVVPDFVCRTDFRRGIEECIAWFREDPRRQVVNPEVDALFDEVIDAWRRRSGT